MAESIIDSLVVLFKIDAKGFKDGTAQINDATDKTREKVGKTFTAMEDGAVKASSAFRSVTTQAFGMFLAFQGASSMTNMIGGMISTAASAERMGQALGMSEGKILSWRLAMKNVGGQASDADQALRTVTGMQQDWMHGRTDQTRAAILSSLGINQNDMRSMSPDQLLTKLAGAKRPYGNVEYGYRLSQLGLSDTMVNFLMQGQKAVSEQTKATKEQLDEYKKQAKAADEMQKNMAQLNESIAKLLVPALNNLIPKISDLVDTINNLINGVTPGAAGGGMLSGAAIGGVGGFMLGGPYGAAAGAIAGGLAGHYVGGKIGAANAGTHAQWPSTMTPNMLQMQVPGKPDTDPIIGYMMQNGLPHHVALGIRAALQNESGANPNALNRASGAMGIGQWLGPRKRRLLERYGPNPNMMQQMEFLLWELRGGDPGGRSVLSADNEMTAMQNFVTNFGRPQGKNWEHLRDWQRDVTVGGQYIAAHNRGHSVTVNVDARGHSNPRAIEQAARNGVHKAMVTQASRTVKQ